MATEAFWALACSFCSACAKIVVNPWIAHVQRSEVAGHQHHSEAVWGYLRGTSLSERQRPLFVYRQCFGCRSFELPLTPRYTSPRLIAAQSQEPLSRDRTKPLKLDIISLLLLTETAALVQFDWRLLIYWIQHAGSRSDSNWPQKRSRDSLLYTLRQGFSILQMPRTPKYIKSSWK